MSLTPMQERIFETVLTGNTPTQRQIARGDQFLADALNEIEKWCERTFIVPAETSTRYFEATSNHVLVLNGADLLMEPAPVIKVEGNKLVETTDYLLEPNDEGTCYTRIRRCTRGIFAVWTQEVTGIGFNAISIEGKWSYAPVMPGEVTAVQEQMAVLMWQDWVRKYGVGGNDTYGTIEPPQHYLLPKHKDMLRDLKKRYIPQV